MVITERKRHHLAYLALCYAVLGDQKRSEMIRKRIQQLIGCNTGPWNRHLQDVDKDRRG